MPFISCSAKLVTDGAIHLCSVHVGFYNYHIPNLERQIISQLCWQALFGSLV